MGPQNVWAAWEALHRYCVRAGSVGPLAVPRSVGKLTSPKNEQIVGLITRQIKAVQPGHPIDCSDDFYAYCWLWSQLLRVSYSPPRALMVRNGDWHNLKWFPLAVLWGRGEEKTTRAFRHWYFEAVQKDYQADEAELCRCFP